MFAGTGSGVPAVEIWTLPETEIPNAKARSSDPKPLNPQYSSTRLWWRLGVAELEVIAAAVALLILRVPPGMWSRGV